MQNRRLYVSLTRDGSIDKAIKALEEYKQELTMKMETFVRKLLDVGIKAGIANSGQYAGMILFEKEVVAGSDDIEGVLIATDGDKIIREWKYKGGIKRAVVSPMLMAEFGSGFLAFTQNTRDYLDKDLGVGQGTFPNQIHAFDKEGWFWETPDGKKHHSYGEAPVYPIHSAVLAMTFEINRIAKEVFNGK